MQLPGPVAAQFALLAERHPQATLQPNPDGTVVVTVPDLPLPPLWTQQQTTVQFIVPIGYPVAPPDCFWADPTLTLGNGMAPMNAGVNIPPWPGAEPRLWFSYHVQAQWRPATDSLLSYLGVIQDRLNRGQ